jgi:histidyl-tRNA synthetase
MFPASLEPVQAVVAASGEPEQREALRLCHRLRAAGLRVELWPGAIKPGKLRKSADERGIPAAVWLEPGATAAASLWLRADGSTRASIPFDQLAELLKRR